MNRTEALEKLSAPSSHERLKAARALLRLANAADLPPIRARLALETVSFVRRALEQAVARIEIGPILAEPAVSHDVASRNSEDRRTYIRAVEWVSTAFLHEILPKLGAIKIEARKAITQYESSPLKKTVDYLDLVLSGIKELRKATVAAVAAEFDARRFLRQIIDHERGDKDVEIHLQGPAEMQVVGAESLLALAVSNALRNAIEATRTSERGSQPVILSWGRTDVDYWITILDHGVGIVGPTESAFQIGRTNKQGHAGFGLAIARQAMETMEGSINLEPGVMGGARVEIRWFR